MHSYQTTLLLLALLVAIVTAVPAPIPEYQRKVEKRSFKVERVRNNRFVKHNGTKSLIKAYRKWAIPLPSGLQGAIDQLEGAAGAAGAGQGSGQAAGADKKHHPSASAAAGTATAAAGAAAATGATGASSNSSGGTGSGTVTATPESGDTEFLAPVSIGGQTLNMDFDSGSSDLWVFNTGLSTADQAGHTNFDPSKSATFATMEGATFDISYGDGSGAAGTVGTDTVNIGGASVTKQAVEIATAVSSSFVEDTQSNGLVGLAFSKLNTVQPTQQNTFFENALSTLAEPVFTADLKHNAVGAYEFGAIDSTKFNGSLTWAAINTTSGFWQFSSQSFNVHGGASMTLTGGQAIADTGTTLMLVNPAIVNAYYSGVSGAVNSASAGGVTFPCNSDLPDLAVDIGGTYMATIPGSIINFAPTDATNTTCFGGVQSSGTSSFQIYGDIMFKAQFVAFNGGNNSIGMAPHS